MSQMLYPVFLAAISSVLVAWVWYGPYVFGPLWSRLSGATPEMKDASQRQMALRICMAFLGSLVIAGVMSVVVATWGIRDWTGAIKMGALLWFGFTAPPMLGMVLWEQRSIQEYLIVSLQWLCTFVVMALILVCWVSRDVELLSTESSTDTLSNRISLQVAQNGVRTVRIAGETIVATIAETPEDRQQGLSGRSRLASNEGMLFVFPEEGYPSFWMKDMNFAIDIIWIATDGTVVHIAPNVAPETFPEAFTPASKARYVLEVPEGFVTTHSVQVGDRVEL